MIVELPSERRRPSVDLLRAVLKRIAAFGVPATLLGSGARVLESVNQPAMGNQSGPASDAERSATALTASQMTSFLRKAETGPSQVSIHPSDDGGYCILLPGSAGHCLVLQARWADAKGAEALASGVERITSDLSGSNDQRTLIGEFSIKLAQAYEETAALCRIMRLTSTQESPSEQIELICTAIAQTLPFRWVATAFRDDPGVIPELRGAAIMSGDPMGGRRAVLETICQIAQGVVDDGWTRVVQPSSPPAGDSKQATNADKGPAEPSAAPRPTPSHSLPERTLADITGGEIVYDRITHDGRVIGVIVAGNKIGTRAQVTSGELQFVDACADLLGMFHENLARVNEQRYMSMGVLKALVNAIDAKDPYTRGHSERVAELSRRIAHAYGFTSEQCERIHVAGLVHDVGKIGVPDWVLRKPGRLNDEEFGIVKLHPEVGYRILQDIPLLSDTLPAVMHHHERFDGKGYPNGLAGENIPLTGRIVALADSFDAMCSSRAYRSGLSRERALAEVRNCAGRQYDPTVVEAFFKVDLTFYDQMLRDQVVQLGEPRREEQPTDGQVAAPVATDLSGKKAA